MKPEAFLLKSGWEDLIFSFKQDDLIFLHLHTFFHYTINIKLALPHFHH